MRRMSRLRQIPAGLGPIELHIRRVSIDRDLAGQESRDPAAFAAEIRAALQGADPGLPRGERCALIEDIARAVHERIASVQPSIFPGKRS